MAYYDLKVLGSFMYIALKKIAKDESITQLLAEALPHF
jgi:hypothetical protein